MAYLIVIQLNLPKNTGGGLAFRSIHIEFIWNVRFEIPFGLMNMPPKGKIISPCYTISCHLEKY